MEVNFYWWKSSSTESTLITKTSFLVFLSHVPIPVSFLLFSLSITNIFKFLGLPYNNYTIFIFSENSSIRQMKIQSISLNYLDQLYRELTPSQKAVKYGCVQSVTSLPLILQSSSHLQSNTESIFSSISYYLYRTTCKIFSFTYPLLRGNIFC